MYYKIYLFYLWQGHTAGYALQPEEVLLLVMAGYSL